MKRKTYEEIRKKKQIKKREAEKGANKGNGREMERETNEGTRKNKKIKGELDIGKSKKR